MGGTALILASVDAPAAEVLPDLLALGTGGRAVWALYGMLPLLLIPAAVGTEALLGPGAPARLRGATAAAGLAALCMLLGLLRWPTLQWSLAAAWSEAASPDVRVVIARLFDGLNLYLGNYIGEFLGELFINGFFLLAADATRGDPRFPRWTAAAGVAAATMGFLAMWRNVTPAVSWIAELENAVLPLWMIVFGVLLVRAAGRERPEEGTPPGGLRRD